VGVTAKVAALHNADTTLATGSVLFITRHYSPAQVAELWALSVDSIRKIFENEPGVLVLGNQRPRRGKRSYTTLRIPAHVLERVHRKMSRV